MFTTTDSVFLIILTCLLSLFTLLGIVLLIVVIKLVGQVKRVVVKAEGVVDSVESAAEVIKDTQGKLAVFKLVRNIVKLVQRSRK
jgi:hypothetical protein